MSICCNKSSWTIFQSAFESIEMKILNPMSVEFIFMIWLVPVSLLTDDTSKSTNMPTSSNIAIMSECADVLHTYHAYDPRN